MPQTEVYEKKEHPDDTGLVEWIPYGMWLAICYLAVIIMTFAPFCERVNPLDPTDDQFCSIEKKGSKFPIPCTFQKTKGSQIHGDKMGWFRQEGMKWKATTKQNSTR